MKYSPSWRYASPLLSAAIVATLLSSHASAALVNEYTFNNGSVEDSVGSQDGTLVNPGGSAFYSNGQVNLTANNGFSSNQDFSSPSAQGAYVDLPNGLISDAASGGDSFAFSFEIWATVQENRTWARIVDFGNSNDGEDVSGSGSDTDYLIVAPRTGLDGNPFGASTHSFTNTEDFVTDPNGELPTGTQHHIVVTVDQNDLTEGDNGTLSLYLNNSLIGSGPVDDEGFIDLTDFDDVNNWLGRAQWGDPLFDGSYNEFSLYDTALSASDVTNEFNAGPVSGGIDVPVVVIDRDTGEVSIANQSPGQVRVVSYSIESAAGALNTGGWVSIDDDNTFDLDGVWTNTSLTAEEIAEGTTGDGGPLASGGNESIGLAWNASPFEDVTFLFELDGGFTSSGGVQYTGGSGTIAPADIDADGDIDVDDWVLFAAASHTDFSGITSAYQRFKNGDLDADGDNDYDDFRLFKADFIASNGAEAFAALAAIPEPSTALLIALGLSALTATRGRQK